jgi:hypothetical protein
MSEIQSKPGNREDDVTELFCKYKTAYQNIVLTLTYDSTWTVSPSEPINGYNVTCAPNGDSTDITFDFSNANYAETAEYDLNSDEYGPYTVTLSAYAG